MTDTYVNDSRILNVVKPNWVFVAVKLKIEKYTNRNIRNNKHINFIKIQI